MGSPGDATGRPAWAGTINESSEWTWRGSKLYHVDALINRRLGEDHGWIRRLLLKLYADQNNSRTVRRALGGVIGQIGSNEWGLNIGAGATRVHPRMINLDIAERDTIDIIARGQKLPFKDGVLKVVVAQEVLEHVRDPGLTVSESLRVLSPGGLLYCQLPFILGYHPGPTDFWRFTSEGIRALFRGPGWTIEESDITRGHGSAFYRVAVEYVAVTASAAYSGAYLPAKGLASALLLPVKFPDLFTRCSPQKDRIPGGYYCIVRKKRTVAIAAQ